MKKLLFVLFCVFSIQLIAEEEKPKLQQETIEARHSLSLNNENFSYTSTTGTMLLRDDEGKETASIFYVAYTKDDVADRSKRPVTFCFNGGPGSSSIWLHLGAFGPKKVAMDGDGRAAYPYRLEENPYTLLDLTDLVFIDPVSTGHSKAPTKEDAKKFHDVEQDICSVAEFIRLYTTHNDRWQSPKYLAGESYGTTRAAGVSNCLSSDHFMTLDGVILISTVLDFQTIMDQDPANDVPYFLFLPSYTATAWYHKKLPAELQKRPLEGLLKEVEAFALEEYAGALAKGDALEPAKRKDITEKLARYTGLSPEYIEHSDLRVPSMRFMKELMRKEGQVVGRFDSRLIGSEGDPLVSAMREDPSAHGIFGGYTAAFNHYMREELGWKKDEEYMVLNHVRRHWNFGPAENKYLNLSPRLSGVMRQNPHTKVFVASGLYDLATPYFGVDYTFNHMRIRTMKAPYVQKEYYPAGHMMYTDKASHSKLKKDLSRFYAK